jgi:hypothetical protein
MRYKSMAPLAIDRFFEPMALLAIGNGSYSRKLKSTVRLEKCHWV